MLAKFGDVTVEYRRVGYYVRRDENLRVPENGHYVQIKHWGELNKKDNVNPYPEIIDKSCGLLTRDNNGREYDYVPLEDRWQIFLWEFWKWASQYRLPEGRIERFYKRDGNFRTFAETTKGSLCYVYVDMVEAHRAFTEAGSPEAGARDVVTSRNMNNKKGYEWLCRPTGGHLGKVIAVDGMYYVLEAIDLLGPCPSIEYVASNPHLYFWCTQYDKFNGTTRFPQIANANSVHNLPPAGTPSPLFSLGGKIKIKRSSCIEMKNGEMWTPYKKI